jgi:hypothetical protein
MGMMVAMASPVFAEEPTGHVTFSGGSVAAGVGFTWGGGTLSFNGSQYPFTVTGLSVVDVGVANIDGTGDVYGLHSVGDFSGTYAAAAAGATVAGGGSLAALENQNGVRIYFHSTTAGLKLNLSANGVTINLK